MAKLKTLFVVAATFGAVYAFGQAAPVISYQGRALRFSPREQPYEINRTIMVPFNPLARAIGAKVRRIKDFWRDADQGRDRDRDRDRNRDRNDKLVEREAFEVSLGRDRLEFITGDRLYRFNGARMTAPQPSQGSGNGMYVSFDMLKSLAGGALQYERVMDADPGERGRVFLKDRELLWRTGESPYRAKSGWYVSAEGTTQYMGAHISVSRDGRVVMTRFNDKIECQIGDNFFYFNGRRRELRDVVVSRNGYTFVPIELFRPFAADDLQVRK